MEIYSSFSSFVFRTPLNSYDKVIDLFDQKIDYQYIIKDKLFEEAIYLTSSALYNSIYIENKFDKNTLKSLYKYYIRFGSRCTPFGLFAGSGVGSISYETDISFSQLALKRSTRLDMDFLNEIASQIQKEYKKKLRYTTNSTGYLIDNQYRYIEYTTEGVQRKYQLNAILLNEFIEKVLSSTTTEKTFDEIVNIIDAPISKSQKIAFIESLIENQIISSKIEPTATGILFSNFIIQFLEKLPKQGAKENLLELLQSINQTLIDVDNSFEGEKIGAYSKIKEKLEATTLSYNANYLFQTDLYFVDKSQKISSRVVADALLGMDILSRFSPEKNKDLEGFKSTFLERYESRIMPLVEVLDDEIGIGYPAKATIGESESSSLIKTINYQSNSINTAHTSSENDVFWLEKYEKAIHEKSNEIVLEKNDWQNFPSKLEKLSPTLSAMLSLIKLKGHDFSILKPIGCTTALNLLGRFCLGNEEINELAFQIAKKEKEYFKDCVIAEIAHIPEKRVGNILMRPNFFDYEITYLSNSQLPAEKQLNINDLLVGVINDEIVLFSKSLKKRIIPRLSNAHNYFENSLPIYNFLCSIQHQEVQTLQLNLGKTFGHLTYTPRIRYKQIIFKLASWRFTNKNFANIKNFQDFEKFCKYWNLPKFVAITEGDNELVIDTEAPLGYELLNDHISKNSITILNEWLQFEVNSKNKNAHTNQIIIPFFKNVPTKPIISTFADEPAVTRSFTPGSEWLYLKLYCGSNISDAWLSKLFLLLTDLESNKFIEKWFFIRYNDPHYHIRLRLKLCKITDYPLVTEKIHKLFQDDLLPKWKLQFDTYERELERYGHQSIEIIESMFHIDSQNYSAILNNKRQELLNDQNRWIFCAYNVDFWLGQFFPDLKERLDLVDRLRTGFMAEFQDDTSIKQNLSNIYRTNREHFESIFIKKVLDKDIIQLEKQLNKNLKNFKNSKESLSKNPHQNLQNLISSCIHMNINRWHLSNQRIHEYFIYDMLFKVYRTIIAQSTDKNNIQNA
jgi:lantibiotic biosynthesis protein